MLQTYIIYLGVIISCCYLASCAARSEKKRYVWIIITILTLISGLRSFDTGLDTYSYVSKYIYIAQGESQYAYGLERSFKAICWLISRISDSGTFFLFVMALLTNGLIMLRFWDYRKISSFPAMVLCYCCVHYFMTMNCIRQFCAVAIVFYGTKFLDQKKLFPFIGGVLMGTMFHTSALVGLLFAMQHFSNWKDLGKQERRFLLLCIVAMPAVLFYVVLITMSKYQKYFTNVELNMGFMLPAKLLLLALSLLFVAQMYRRFRYQQRNGTGLQKEEVDRIPWICYAYILWLMFASFGYFFRYMDRIGWYFYPFEGIYYGMFRKDRDVKNKLVFGGAFVMILLYALVDALMNNGQGNVPYSFVWQIF